MLNKLIIAATAFLLGALTVYMSVFTIADIGGPEPSYVEPLTEEQFLKAQTEGKALFRGSPTTERNYGYSVETSIECDRKDGFCYMASAYIINYTDGPYLNSVFSKYEITNWSEQGGISAYFDDECGRYTIEADVQSREVKTNYASDPNQDSEKCVAQPAEGENKLDFNLSSKPIPVLGSFKSNLHYMLGEWFN